jgi:excisionase family DNA binding protein
MIDGRKIVTIMMACDIVGVSRRTMYHWIKTGKVQYVRTAGGPIRIFEDSLFRKQCACSDPVNVRNGLKCAEHMS